jgi:hypothetical protein
MSLLLLVVTLCSLVQDTNILMEHIVSMVDVHFKEMGHGLFFNIFSDSLFYHPTIAVYLKKLKVLLNELKKLAQVVTFLTYVCEVPSLNLGQSTDYPF